MKIDGSVTSSGLLPAIRRVWGLSARKIHAIEQEYDASLGSPVFTVGGKYTARGWTEWTQGFRYGSMLLQFEATGDRDFLNMGRRGTVADMASHVTHFGVHDHGFNNVSTYGNLLRLIVEGKIDEEPWERLFYELALKCSGAVQARRWSTTSDGGGYIYSFNGPHSLFADTIRSLRVLAIAHRLGHGLMGEQDASVSLLERLVQHAAATAKYNVYYGKGRDAYDVRGRVAHEAVFNVNDGAFRCPNSQQGFSPFTTWTRGLAWVLCGFAEQLQFMGSLDDGELEPYGGRDAVEGFMLEAALAVGDYYIDATPADGIPYWDTGAPGLAGLGDYLENPADPFNKYEPVDSSAAAIAAQGLLRLGKYMEDSGRDGGGRYRQAGLTVAQALFAEPYLSTAADHQGLILHCVYHRPNGWDYVPEGRAVPCNESGMWGDYHARELALYIQRMAGGEPELRFFAE